MIKYALACFMPMLAKAISSSDCSYLGVPNQEFNGSNNPCVCEPGWIGNKCNQLNFETVTEAENAYSSGAYTTYNPTWGGSIIKARSKYFFIGAVFPNDRGLSCWPSTSTTGIMSADTLTGPWTLISYVANGDYPGYDPDEIPWSHNAVATVEFKLANASDLNSARTYAFSIYAIRKYNKNSNFMLPAYFGAPNTKLCTTGWAKRFPVDKQNQITHVAYKLLASHNQTSIETEVFNLLQSRSKITKANGVNRTVYISKEFKWLNLGPKIPNVHINAVNPAPLVSYVNNYGSLIRNVTGHFNRVLTYRFANKRESIAFLGLSASQFIWDQNAKYFKGPVISLAWNIEDPFLFESRYGYHLIVHDGRVCGQWDSCGSIMHFPKDLKGVDMLDSAARWSKPPTMLYNYGIKNLKDRASKRQRPGLYFNNSAPLALLNGLIWANTQKQSRTYLALIQA